MQCNLNVDSLTTHQKPCDKLQVVRKQIRSSSIGSVFCVLNFGFFSKQSSFRDFDLWEAESFAWRFLLGVHAFRLFNLADKFDESRLDSTMYQMNDPKDVCRYQDTVEDFLDVVRTAPQSFHERPDLIRQFIRFLDTDDTWPIAAMVMPELRLSKNHDTSKQTPMNIVLNNVVHRRPPVPISDALNSAEKLFVKQSIMTDLTYIWTEGRGLPHATEEELEDI